MTSGCTDRTFFYGLLRVLSFAPMAAAVLVGCGKRVDYEAKPELPTKKLGTLLTLSSASEASELHAWAQSVGVKVRNVYPKAGLFEVFASKNEVETRFPNGQVEENQYFEIEKMGVDFGSIQGCQDEENPPLVDITSEKYDPDLDVNEFYWDPEKWNFRWVIADLLMGLVYDTFGRYQGLKIRLQLETTREPRKSESIPIYRANTEFSSMQRTDEMFATQKVIRFGVTVNTPYAGALAARKFSVDDAKKFSHLNAISADKTWEYAQGEGVTIAIIDSGVNYNHPDISQNIKINLAEIPGNGKDDDKNGFVDDAYGYDFASEDEFPLDDSGHGTHVASLAASAVFGVAPKAKILPIKVFNAFGGADMGTLSAGIRYAVDMGADVINCSLGMRVDKEKGFPEVLESALEYAKSKNVIVAAAAGNGDYRGVGYDIDRKPYAPASSTSSNVVSVASTKRDGSLASYSNFGRKTVDLGAPGGSQVDGDLLGAHYLPEIRLYEGHSGTSMATPVVSGTFALLKSIAPKANHQVLIDTLIESGVEVLELKLRIKSGKMIDTLTAVRKLKSAIEKQAEQSTHSMDLSAR